MEREKGIKHRYWDSFHKITRTRACAAISSSHFTYLDPGRGTTVFTLFSEIPYVRQVEERFPSKGFIRIV